MWTDTSEFRNPHYHLPSDTPDTLDYDFLTRVAQLALALNGPDRTTVLSQMLELLADREVAGSRS